MFRTLLLAVLAALALSSIAVGTAQAATPVPTAEGGSCKVSIAGVDAPGLLDAAGLCVKLEVGLLNTNRHSNPSDRDTEAECVAIPGDDWYWDGNSCERRRGGDNSHNCRDWEYWDGNSCERRNGGPIYNGPRYNSCDEYRTHNMRDFRRGDSRWNDSWDRNRNGIACDNDDVIVSEDGDCVTYATARDSIRNYSNDYTLLRNRYNGDWNRLNNSERDNLSRLYQLNQRYRGDWDNRYSKLRTICKDDTPPVTIINEAPPPAVIITQAPAAGNPVPYGSGGGQVSRVPSGPAQTGDGSTQL